MKRALVMLMCGVLAACSGGKAVRVDCDGPLTLINPPVAGAADKAAPGRGVRPAAGKTEARGP